MKLVLQKKLMATRFDAVFSLISLNGFRTKLKMEYTVEFKNDFIFFVIILWAKFISILFKVFKLYVD